MISKSKLGAIAFVATMGLALPIGAIGLASPAFAISKYNPALNGGGSTGYNRNVEQNFRLKQHPAKSHTRHQQSDTR
jgi:hypothetical protein